LIQRARCNAVARPISTTYRDALRLLTSDPLLASLFEGCAIEVHGELVTLMEPPIRRSRLPSAKSDLHYLSPMETMMVEVLLFDAQPGGVF